MLRMNQLQGFGVVPAAGGGSVQPRYVGQYSLTFSASDQAAVMIPQGDFQLAGSGRQLLIGFYLEQPLFVFCAAGVDPNFNIMPAISVDGGMFSFLCGNYVEDDGDVVVTVIVDDVYTENGALHCWEIVGAAPLPQSYAAPIPLALTTAVMGRYCPVGGVTIANGMNTADTATFTWTGLTERVDADAGDYRVTVADELTPAVAEARTAITAVTSTGQGRLSMLCPVPEDLTGVRGGFLIFSPIASAGSDITISSPQEALVNHQGCGDFTLLVCVAHEHDSSNVTGVTYDGVAMTSRGSVNNTTASPDLRMSIWSINVVEDTNPIGDIQITFAGSTAATNVCIAIARLYDVGSFGTAVTSTGNGTGTAVTPNINAGGMLIGMHLRATDTQATTWSGIEGTADIDVGPYRFSMGWRPQCEAEVGRSVNATNASASQFATLVLPVNPAT